MVLNNVILISLLVVIAQCQTTNTEIHGCISSSSKTVVQGNYTKYIDFESHSIWIQKVSIGSVYVIYFDENMGANNYKAFGLYRCDNALIYTSSVQEMSVKSPDGIMGCEGSPILFCPALDESDAMSLIDGMAAADGTLDWIDQTMKDFYNCTHWFEYNEETNYPSTATLTFDKNIWCASSTSNTKAGVVIPGGTQHHTSDKKTKNKMSKAGQAVLWTIISAFILFCICAIVYFIMKRKTKIEIEKSRNDSRVGLVDEKEEDKFGTDYEKKQQEHISTPLVDEDEIENNQIIV